MCCEIKRKLARISVIGAEAQTADRTDIVTRPNAFALSVCHQGPEADFFGWHAESLHRFQSCHKGGSFRLTHYPKARCTLPTLSKELHPGKRCPHRVVPQ